MALEQFLHRMIVESKAQHWTSAYEACRTGLLLSGRFRGWTDADIMRVVRKAFPEKNDGRKPLPDLRPDLPGDIASDGSPDRADTSLETESRRDALLREAIMLVRNAMIEALGTDSAAVMDAGREALTGFLDRLMREEPGFWEVYGPAIAHLATHLHDEAETLFRERGWQMPVTELPPSPVAPSQQTPLPNNLTPLVEGQVRDGIDAFLRERIRDVVARPRVTADLTPVECALPLGALWRAWCMDDASRTYDIDPDRMQVLFNRATLELGYQLRWDTVTNDFLLAVPFPDGASS